jgi:hypothetical protein
MDLALWYIKIEFIKKGGDKSGGIGDGDSSSSTHVNNLLLVDLHVTVSSMVLLSPISSVSGRIDENSHANR